MRHLREWKAPRPVLCHEYRAALHLGSDRRHLAQSLRAPLRAGGSVIADTAVIILAISPHPVPLPVGEGTVLHAPSAIQAVHSPMGRGTGEGRASRCTPVHHPMIAPAASVATADWFRAPGNASRVRLPEPRGLRGARCWRRGAQCAAWPAGDGGGFRHDRHAGGYSPACGAGRHQDRARPASPMAP